MGLQQNRTKIDKTKGTFTLSCSASADPKPEMIWEKDGVLLKKDDNMKPTEKPNVYVSTYDLSFINENQAGKYSCTAINLDGTDSSSTDVLILGNFMVSSIIDCSPLCPLNMCV